jgi:tetratricopeptide (TPR) repeat protein
VSGQLDALVTQAALAREASHWLEAIELLRAALSLDSTHARAHAELALALVDAHRLRAAEREATLALGYATAGDDASATAHAHYALAAVHAAHGRPIAAWAHCERALATSGMHLDARILGAHLKDQLGDSAAALELARGALALHPDDAHALAVHALFQSRIDVAVADASIQRALTLAPLDLAVNLAAARIALDAHDNIDGARKHLRVVLGRDSYHREALTMWLATKARTEPVATHLWRVGLWMRRTIDLEHYGVICAWMVIATLASIIARHVGAIAIANYLRYAWMLFFAGVWIARYLSTSFDAEINGLPG